MPRGVYPHKPVPVDIRFWKKVDKRGLDECWPWTAHTVAGYGKINIDGTPRMASHVSYYLAHGEYPNGLCVLHKCDNPACVNPNHLFLGTHKDNVADKVQKERQNRGETSPGAKLTEEQVREIRRRWSVRSDTQAALAREFSVCHAAISLVCGGQRWAHIV